MVCGFQPLGTRLLMVWCLTAVLTGLFGCDGHRVDSPSATTSQTAPPVLPTRRAGKTGVLLVSHGSHSPQWRQVLLDSRDSVEPQILALPGIEGLRSAFMEYTEPSIATQLKAFDQEGYDDVIIVPLLLTVSSHSFDDIPTIIGAKEDAKSMMTIQAEGIERYAPRARMTITPLLDFSSLLKENVSRRVAALSRNPAAEGAVLVAYGSEPYNDEWEDFFGRLDDVIRKETGVAAVIHCWCGHGVQYSRTPTKDAIRKILSQCDRAIVVPVLVARDDFFQDQIIARAVEEVGAKDRVAYVPDAILPDPRLNEWVVSITRETYARIHGRDAHAGE